MIRKLLEELKALTELTDWELADQMNLGNQLERLAWAISQHPEQWDTTVGRDEAQILRAITKVLMSRTDLPFGSPEFDAATGEGSSFKSEPHVKRTLKYLLKTARRRVKQAKRLGQMGAKLADAEKALQANDLTVKKAAESAQRYMKKLK